MAFTFYHRQPEFPFHRFVDEVFEPVFALKRTSTQSSLTASEANRSWSPSMDLHENAETNTITTTFELPGLKKENVKIEVVRDRLTVSGETSTIKTTLPSDATEATAVPTESYRSVAHEANEGFIEVDSETNPPSATNQQPAAEAAQPPKPENPTARELAADCGASETAPTTSHGYYAIRERRWGKFARTLKLPRGVKPDDIKATMADGVLTVTYPRSILDQAPQRISIA